MRINRPVLSKEEQEIRAGLQIFSDMVQDAFAQTSQALSNMDIPLCEDIIANDKNLNAQHKKIEQDCLSAIATQQPVATDLRVLMAAIHISVELERIADHLAGIANTIVKMAKAHPANTVEDIREMAANCKRMLQQAIQAYMEHDSELAQRIAEQDLSIDKMQTRITSEIIAHMCNNTDAVPFGTCLLWIVHSLERIGDRATNICEQVIYIEKGDILDLNQ